MLICYYKVRYRTFTVECENMNRDEKFGRAVAVANVLHERVKDVGEPGIASMHLTDMGSKPARTLERLHHDLIKHAHKFGADEMILFDMMSEIIADISLDDFTNNPLSNNYLVSYYSQQHVLNNIMGTEEAAEKWGLAQDYIKRLCREGKVSATLIGKTWVLDKNQPNPKKAGTKEE
ncbi:helix-turn-helix domain-containing protein [Paenibacillus terreus]|uniref:helix-turn-helix domain-containing protein n=1 Tax=Paenibacillus terreus TaxID=1387834 RepID=UPI0035CD01F7